MALQTAFDISAVYSSINEAGANLGDIFETKGKVYVFLKGVSGTAANQAVTYDENFATALIAANGVGPVAVAQAAVVDDKYGWYQVYGNASVLSGTVAADKALYVAASNLIDDASVSGDKINGMISRAASSGGSTAVWMMYPYIDDASSAGA